METLSLALGEILGLVLGLSGSELQMTLQTYDLRVIIQKLSFTALVDRQHEGQLWRHSSRTTCQR